MAGRTVQINSINCPLNKKRFVNLLKNIINIKCETKIVIKIKINIEWSWNKINCSIKGEFLSWIFIFDHEAIFNKRKFLYLWSLNSLHYSAILNF